MKANKRREELLRGFAPFEGEQLPGPVAAEMFLKDPTTVFITFGSIMKQYHLSKADLLDELKSGRLVATMTEDGPMVRADNMVEWMDRRVN
jgi:hypothetical protein